MAAATLDLRSCFIIITNRLRYSFWREDTMSGWGKLRNEELYKLYCISKKIRRRELGRKGHAAQIGEVRNT
jgi:hypothetical protein